jgi:hypothetical protein
MFQRKTVCTMDLRAAQIWLVSGCVLLASGCGWFSSSDPDSYQSVKEQRVRFTDLVTNAGGSTEEKRYPQFGMAETAWVIDLGGATVSDELIDDLIGRMKREYISELDFSGSTLTEDQLIKLDEADIGRTLIRLNLSDTGITDSGIDQIDSMKFLVSLNLSGTEVSKAAADRLEERVMTSRPPASQKIVGPLKVEL